MTALWAPSCLWAHQLWFCARKWTNSADQVSSLFSSPCCLGRQPRMVFSHTDKDTANTPSGTKRASKLPGCDLLAQFPVEISHFRYFRWVFQPLSVTLGVLLQSTKSPKPPWAKVQSLWSCAPPRELNGLNAFHTQEERCNQIPCVYAKQAAPGEPNSWGWVHWEPTNSKAGAVQLALKPVLWRWSNQ